MQIDRNACMHAGRDEGRHINRNTCMQIDRYACLQIVFLTLKSEVTGWHGLTLPGNKAVLQIYISGLGSVLCN